MAKPLQTLERSHTRRVATGPSIVAYTRPRSRRARIGVSAVLFAGVATVAVGSTTSAQEPVVGPAHGTLIIAGGGRLDDDIMQRFVDLAGGDNARIVVIPTASEQDTFPQDWGGTAVFRDAGIAHITVLHTRDPKLADTEAFVAPLREATGVWIPGGRQWRLADAYLGTRTLRELHAVLERGGVIGGSSAGASIQASYMVRGAPEGNHIMMAQGHEHGFGFLRETAIDQHLITRGRENDLLEVIARYPTLLGIGLDEGTAILVRGDEAEVIGRSKVAFYNAKDANGAPYYFLQAGDVFDLAERRTRYGDRLPPTDPGSREAIAVVQALFDSMRRADTVAIRTLFHPNANTFALRAAQPGVRVSTVDDFTRTIAAATARLDERFREPEVRIDGLLATVWTYYDFYNGDRFSHCGMDAFQLAHLDGGWKIISIAYTVRQEQCRNSS